MDSQSINMIPYDYVSLATLFIDMICRIDDYLKFQFDRTGTKYYIKYIKLYIII